MVLKLFRSPTPVLTAPIYALLAAAFFILCEAMQPVTAAPLKPNTLHPDMDAAGKAQYLELVYVDGKTPQVLYRNQENDGEEKVALHLECKRNLPPHKISPAKGAWIWKSGLLLNKQEAARQFFRKAATHGINRIYLQINADLAQDTPILKMAKEQSIQIYALTGSPDDIDHPQAVFSTIDNILNYNSHHDLQFSGIQFDIEPYILPNFQMQEQQILSRYLELVQAIGARIAGRMPLSFAVPFWFDQKSVNGVNIMASVIQVADDISVMSYRTSLDQILSVANNALCYGEKFGKPVYLGIELTKIPDEVHFISKTSELLPYLQSTGDGSNLTRETMTKIAMTQLPNIKQTVIPGSRLSFYPDEKMAFSITEQAVPYLFFAGWMLNGLDGIWLDD